MELRFLDINVDASVGGGGFGMEIDCTVAKAIGGSKDVPTAQEPSL